MDVNIVLNSRIDRLKEYAFKINYLKVCIKISDYEIIKKQQADIILNVLYNNIKDMIYRQCCMYEDVVINVLIYKQNVFSEIFNKKRNIKIIKDDNKTIYDRIVNNLNDIMYEINNDIDIFDRTDELKSINNYINKLIKILYKI